MVTLSFVGLIVLFFLLDFLFVRDLEKPADSKRGKSLEVEPEPADEVVMPRGYFFHPGHSWVRILESGEVAVGVDDVVSAAVGAVTGFEAPRKDEPLNKGEAAFKLIAGGRALDFVSPVTGTVSSVNTALEKDMGAINSDPYGKGWLFTAKVAPGGVALPSDETAAKWMKSELNRLRDFVAVYRRGSSFRGTLTGANNQVWAVFQDSFLGSRAQKEA
jgi:glycine cleavage system H lipoate-binding protein